ncbi:MAG: FAD-dependent oxidoreductase [Kineosporiaceae bacterium]|nr:FAD-dependent oxidoreductase [Kineosporiaceae bacterium]
MTRRTAPYVVVGGGPAAAAATRVIAQAGGQVVLITEEPEQPYDRTSLSKQVLLDPDAEPPPLWDPSERRPDRVEILTGTSVVRIDPGARTVHTSDGDTVGYDRLLLATGARPRTLDLPGLPGSGVHHLRVSADARALRADLHRAGPLVVIGGGVLGLEVAAAAIGGRQVRVVEAGSRILGRGIPAPVATRLAQVHREHGVNLLTGVAPVSIERSTEHVAGHATGHSTGRSAPRSAGRPGDAGAAGGFVSGVRLSDGERLPAAVVVVAVGIAPREELARDSGIATADGILVDSSCRTDVPGVWAAGDVARMRVPGHPGGLRFEAFTVAQNQGVVAARSMLGEQVGDDQVPFTWSDQYGLTLQHVGLGTPGAEQVSLIDGEGEGEAVLVLELEGDRLVAACGLGRGSLVPRAIRAAQRLIGRGGRIEVEALREQQGDLDAVVRLLRSPASPG